MNQSSLASESAPLSTPQGYLRLAVSGRSAVACDWAAPAIREIIAERTLHGWAASQADHESMHGRGINYGVILPAGKEPEASTAVVVRRNRHGGLFGSITGELFRLPTRAPLELANALRLTAAGVDTPEVIAYATYPALLNLVRCDLVTRRLPKGGDFPDVWRTADTGARDAMLEATAVLLRNLAAAGAWHADLNLKNIYISGNGSGMKAYILDVDRVTFPGRKDIGTLNFARLARSARKWRNKWGLDFDEKAIERLAVLSGEIR